MSNNEKIELRDVGSERIFSNSVRIGFVATIVFLVISLSMTIYEVFFYASDWIFVINMIFYFCTFMSLIFFDKKADKELKEYGKKIFTPDK